MYAYMHIHMHMHIRMYIHIGIWIDTHIYIYMCIYVCLCVCRYIVLRSYNMPLDVGRALGPKVKPKRFHMQPGFVSMQGPGRILERPL